MLFSRYAANYAGLSVLSTWKNEHSTFHRDKLSSHVVIISLKSNLLHHYALRWWRRGQLHDTVEHLVAGVKHLVSEDGGQGEEVGVLDLLLQVYAAEVLETGRVELPVLALDPVEVAASRHPPPRNGSSPLDR